MNANSMRTGFFRTETVLAIALLIAAPTNLRAEPFFRQRDLFISGHDDVNIYRIPSLIVSPKGTILAFCEAREATVSLKTTPARNELSNHYTR